MFFGAWDETPDARDEREIAAKAICVVCPVRLECLTVAVVAPVRYGVWGGMGEPVIIALSGSAKSAAVKVSP